MANIVILDGYAANPGDLSWEPLKEFGTVTVYERTPADQIIPRIREADYVYTNKVPLSREAIDSAPKLKWIGVLATGYNIVDIQYAREKGIPVSNVPAYSSATVLQNVFAHLLHICHHVGDHAASVSKGKWAACQDFCFWDYPQIELEGKYMGIIGYGDIGKKVAKAALAFGMKLLIHTPHPEPSLETENLSFTDLDSLLEKSDVISLHCPLTPATGNMIDQAALKKMKSTAILINTGRGPLIDEDALAQALNQGEIFAAGLDVLCQEPPQKDNPLFQAKNCFISPHISWSSKEARIRLHQVAFDNLRSFLEGRPVNIVNL